MLKYLFFSFFLWSLTTLTYAQRVGVNHRQPTETLDVNGTLRVRKLPLPGEAAISTQSNGVMSPTPTVVFTPKHIVAVDKNGVLGLRKETPTFFYMPPMVLPTTEAEAMGSVSYAGGVFTVNLYDEYVAQFVTHAPTVSSSSIPLHQWAANELDYHVTYYDTNVFTNVAVNAQGVLTYQVKPGAQVNERTFFNIVLQVK